jgi:MtN3 and saliva related transmembrane protein
VIGVAAVGLVAGALTTCAWMPQLARTWRSRHADDISWGYLGLLGAGIALWVAYGVADHSFAVELANALTLVFVVGIAVLKAGPSARARRRERARRRAERATLEA